MEIRHGSWHEHICWSHVVLFHLWLTCGGLMGADVEYIDHHDMEMLYDYAEAFAVAMDLSLEEYIDGNSDFSHMGFEVEDPVFAEKLLEESPFRDEIIETANLIVSPEYPEDDEIIYDEFPAVDLANAYLTNDSSRRVKRTAINDNQQLWPDGRIPYVLSYPVKNSALYRNAILEALAHINEVTCVQFREGNPKTIDKGEGRRKKYVKFVRGTFCHSSVGMGSGVGAQEVSLSRSCAYPEMVIHELGHLLGLWHEHARTDRDNNVLVLINNVGPDYQHNFEKATPMRLFAPYDLSSMMHYTMNTFTATGERTITPLDPDMAFLIGNKQQFSFYDIQTLNRLYNCSEGCRYPPACENGGFLIKNCTCMCPAGLTGKTCSQVITDAECGGVTNIEYGTVVTSPAYPGNYPDDVQCLWLIKSPRNTVITMQVPDLDIEQSRLGTCRDRLEIRYHHIGISEGPVYCGRSLNRTFITTSNHLLIRFSSNYVRSRRGFRAVIATQPKSDCSSNPCLNGGTCHDYPDIGTYFCDCVMNWVGHTCDKEIRNGGWGEWSTWTTCIAPCGTQSRSRTCTDPTPHNGGSDCEGPHYESRDCGNSRECQGAYICNFGSSAQTYMCDLIQEEDTDSLDWQIHHGATSSQNTGPTTGHTSGLESDNYLYLEASFGKPYDDAILWFPPADRKVGMYCLQLFYHMRGESVGSLVILRKISSRRAVVMWQRSGNQGAAWGEVTVNVLFFRGVELGIIAVRGDTYSSDIAVDDLSISPGTCQEPDDGSGFQEGCTFDGVQRRVGPFMVTDGCIQMNCFCNPDGLVDCPEWQYESVCDIMELTEDKKKFGRKRWKPSKLKLSMKGWTSKKERKTKKKKQNTSGIVKKRGIDPEEWPYWLRMSSRRHRIRKRYRTS